MSASLMISKSCRSRRSFRFSPCRRNDSTLLNWIFRISPPIGFSTISSYDGDSQPRIREATYRTFQIVKVTVDLLSRIIVIKLLIGVVNGAFDIRRTKSEYRDYDEASS